MKKNVIIVNEYELSVLKNMDFNEFTIAGLRSLFDTSCAHLDAIPESRVHQRMYRMTQRLMSQGVLVQVSNSKNEREKTYKKTPLFAETEFLVRGCKKMVEEKQTKTMVNLDRRSGSPDAGIDEQLKNRIRVYQVDLLTSIGESEEYKRLGYEYPGLKQKLEQSYLDARERSSRLLGQIKALKHVLQQLPQQQGQAS